MYSGFYRKLFALQKSKDNLGYVHLYSRFFSMLTYAKKKEKLGHIQYGFSMLPYAKK
jgi:hypothetical protein